jgi:hypothetical protein
MNRASLCILTLTLGLMIGACNADIPAKTTPEEVGIGTAQEYADQDDPVQDASVTPGIPTSDIAFNGLRLLNPLDTKPRFNEVARGLAIDSQNNLIVVGHEDSSTTITSTSAGTSDPISYYQHNAQADVFVRKLSPSGETIWSRTFGGSNYEYARAVAIGPDDTIFVAGMTDSKTVRGLSINLLEDAFITAYSKDGKRLWTRLLGGSLSDAATAVAVDQKGYVYVSGYTTGVNSPSDVEHRSFMGTPVPGLLEVFLAKYNAKGTRLWTKFVGTERMGIQKPGGVAVNSKGEVLLAGTTFRGLADAQDAKQVFLVRFSSDGTPLAKPTLFKPDGLGSISVRSISIDPADNVILAGGTTAQLLGGQSSKLITRINQTLGANAFCTLGRDIIPTGRANDGTFETCADGYIMKFNSQLEPVWTRLVSNDVSLDLDSTQGAAQPERLVELHTVRTDAAGNIFVLGRGYTPSTPRSKKALTANWPLKYSSDGTFLGSAKGLSTTDIRVQGIGGIALDKAGSVFLAGDFGQLDDGSVVRPANAILMPEDAANMVNTSSYDLRVFLTHLNTDLK